MIDLDESDAARVIFETLKPALSNAAWEAKQPDLIRYSKLNLNRYFHQVDPSDEVATHARGERVFQNAVEIWPYPVSKLED